MLVYVVFWDNVLLGLFGCLCLSMCVCLLAYVCVRTCIFFMCICVFVCLLGCASVCVFLFVYVYLCVCVICICDRNPCTSMVAIMSICPYVHSYGHTTTQVSLGQTWCGRGHGQGGELFIYLSLSIITAAILCMFVSSFCAYVFYCFLVFLSLILSFIFSSFLIFFLFYLSSALSSFHSSFFFFVIYFFHSRFSSSYILLLLFFHLAFQFHLFSTSFFPSFISFFLSSFLLVSLSFAFSSLLNQFTDLLRSNQEKKWRQILPLPSFLSVLVLFISCLPPPVFPSFLFPFFSFQLFLIFFVILFAFSIYAFSSIQPKWGQIDFFFFILSFLSFYISPFPTSFLFYFFFLNLFPSHSFPF